MKNVYFRPVLASVEAAEGDPYMIALDCVAQLADDLRIPLITLTASMVTLFILALRNKQAMPRVKDGNVTSNRFCKEEKP